VTAWIKRPRAEIVGLLRAEGIEPRRRGETLSIDEFIRLARAVKRGQFNR
jgi:hypothetical protein